MTSSKGCHFRVGPLLSGGPLPSGFNRKVKKTNVTFGEPLFSWGGRGRGGKVGSMWASSALVSFPRLLSKVLESSLKKSKFHFYHTKTFNDYAGMFVKPFHWQLVLFPGTISVLHWDQNVSYTLVMLELLATALLLTWSRILNNKFFLTSA